MLIHKVHWISLTCISGHKCQAHIKQMFQERILKAGNKKAIIEFSEKYVDSEKLVSDYIEHLTGI